MIKSYTITSANDVPEHANDTADRNQAQKAMESDYESKSMIRNIIVPVIERYTVTSANDPPERDPKDWQFQGWNDGTNWTTLATQNGQTFPARY
jgi:hypothetical protein